MKLLRRALLAVAAQVFQNGFDGDFGAIEAALVRLDNLLMLLCRSQQALRGLSKVR